MSNEPRFAVVVRFEKPWDASATVPSPKVFWHRSPLAASKRLASIINGKAAWLKGLGLRAGTRLYIVDHADPEGVPLSLTEFRKRHALEA